MDNGQPGTRGPPAPLPVELTARDTEHDSAMIRHLTMVDPSAVDRTARSKHAASGLVQVSRASMCVQDN